MKSLIWWNRLAFFFLLLGAAILAIAFTLQPKVSDDFHILWGFQKAHGTLDWIAQEYRQTTGRVWIIALTTFVLPYPFLETAYRAFTVLEIALLGALAWYCALGHGAWLRTMHNVQAFTIFGILLWFALPARNETVAWLVGNFAYFVPALFGLAFIAWLEHSPINAGATNREQGFLASNIWSFLLGIGAGVSHEQIVAACVAYVSLVIFPFSRRLLLGRKYIDRRVWIGALGLLIGAAVLISAPSNYTRMAVFATPSLKELISRMILYLSGAYFDLGTETTGKFIWMGALLFIALFSKRDADGQEIVKRLKRGTFWAAISLVTLLAMAPATNFISTRTTFFAVIFFYIAIAALTLGSPLTEDRGRTNEGRIPAERTTRLALSTAVFTILALLVFVESAATLISNASLSAEAAEREEIVKHAVASTAFGDKSPILVPFFATQPAALTYMQNPQHDADFLSTWGSQVGHVIRHDMSEGAPLPNSISPIKAIKFRR